MGEFEEFCEQISLIEEDKLESKKRLSIKILEQREGLEYDMLRQKENVTILKDMRHKLFVWGDADWVRKNN